MLLVRATSDSVQGMFASLVIVTGPPVTRRVDGTSHGQDAGTEPLQQFDSVAVPVPPELFIGVVMVGQQDEKMDAVNFVTFVFFAEIVRIELAPAETVIRYVQSSNTHKQAVDCSQQ